MNATTTKGSGRWPTANCQDVTLLFLHRTLPRMIWRFPRPREISKKCWYVACFLASLSRSFDCNYQFRCITSDNHGTALYYVLCFYASFFEDPDSSHGSRLWYNFRDSVQFPNISVPLVQYQVPPVLWWFLEQNLKKEVIWQVPTRLCLDYLSEW